MLGDKKVNAYHVPSRKKQAQFYERLSKRPQTLKKLNVQNFLVELEPLYLKSFQGSQKQFQRLVMLRTDVYVTADRHQAKWPDKRRIV